MCFVFLVPCCLLFSHLLPLPRPAQNGPRSHSIRARQHCVHQVRIFSSGTLTPAHRISRYWGKRDTRLILPTNSSLSVTLDQDHLRSTTTSRADASFEAGDRLWLNGKEEAIKEGGRLAVCIKELRAWRNEMETKDKDLPKVRLFVLLPQ